jgi:predicted regulator of Ras-like GTPase activity (Roadblock/LC7/MglB family)
MTKTSEKLLRGGFTIYTGQEKAIQDLINDLAKRTLSTLIMVTDTAGEPIQPVGDLEGKKRLALGSLLAGDLAASQETAKIIGQYNTYQLIIREGVESNLFISEAGKQLILMCVIPARTPLGWSRLLVKETSKQIAAIASTSEDQIDSLELGLDDELMADKYGDSLSSIWNG